MTTHAEARQFATEVLRLPLSGAPSAGEIKALCGVACLETHYGDGWKGTGKGSFNQGAIQCGASWKGDRFSYVDTHPNADGTSTPYHIDFRKYPNVDAGWSDLATVVFVNRGRHVVAEAADRFDWMGVSKTLHDTGYYEGVGSTVSERINHHYRALSRAIADADNATAPIVPVVALPQTLRKGDGKRNEKQEAVKLLQRELQLAADGEFGLITEHFLSLYQGQGGLTPDGICGPKTWAALFADDYVPETQRA